MGHGDRGGVQQRRCARDDATYHLMVTIYEALNEPGVSKAEALGRAQAKLIATPAYQHLFYWSPFLLISNWL